MKIIINFLVIVVLSVPLSGCQKYLDVIPKDKVVPTTTDDFRLLLNDQFTMNNSTGLGDISSDDARLSDAQYNSLSLSNQNAYIWNTTIYKPIDDVESWNRQYKAISFANTILEGLEKNSSGLPADRDQVKGEAHFFRAYSYFNLVNLFARQFTQATAGSDKGVPLRLTPDPYQKVTRASVKDVYTQIFKDLNAAVALLTDPIIYKTRPTKGATHGLLARAYLQTGEYSKALQNATLALNSVNTLIDYNEVPLGSQYGVTFPISVTSNAEVMFLSFSTDLRGNQYYISADQYNSYDPNDLRRLLFFNFDIVSGGYQFIGNYHDGGRTPTPAPFSGISTAELYLIRAECYARNNNVTNCLADLNKLLINRYKAGTFIPVMASTGEVALNLVLTERRKELIFRNLRWGDLKRLNTEASHAVTLSKTIGGKTYTLTPNSNNYIIPIPDQEIQLTGIQQNPRD